MDEEAELVTRSHEPAPDPIEEAVAALLRDGGEVTLETDRLSSAETWSGLRISHVGKDHGRALLQGSVTAFVGRQGPALDALGWVPSPLDEMQAPDRVAVEEAESRRREHGVDYRLGYLRRWELPPSTPAGVAAQLRATLQVFDDRPVELVRYVVRRDRLDQGTVGTGMVVGCFSLLLGCLAAGFLVLMPRAAASDLVTHAGIAGIVALVGAFFLGVWLLERLPGGGKWGWLPLWIGMLILPAAAVIGWALWGF